MISKIAQDIQDSPTMAIGAKARLLSQQGEKIIDLGVGYLDHEPPTALTQGLIKSLDKKNTGKYIATAGLTELRKHIANKLTQQHGVSFAPEQILITSWAKSGVFLALTTILNSGDEVIIQAPLWPSYTEQIKIVGGTPIIIPATENCRLDIDAIEQKISPKTKAIIITSPNNPSGIVYNIDELQAIIQLAEKHDLYIISDEIYKDFTFDIQYPSISHIANEQQRNHIIIIDGFSKNIAIPWWRIGFVVASIKVTNAAQKILSNMMWNTSSIEQYALVELFEQWYDEAIQELHTRIADNRKQVIDTLDEANISYIKPNGALYFLIRIPTSNSIQFCDELLENQKVVAIPGVYFWLEWYIRICYATDIDTVKKGLQKIIEKIHQA